MTDKKDSEPPENYENKIKKNSFPGLLGVFEERLKNRNKEDTENSDEFSTINITSSSIIKQKENTSIDKVSEEEIDSLLKQTPTKYESNFQENDEKPINVEETVSKYRYEDNHPVIEKSASSDDVKIGYDPINSSNNIESKRSTTPVSHPPSAPDLTSQPYSQKGISDDDVMKHITKHRKEKAQQVDAEDIISD
jgi:hypothetical protein|tara:strand:+ start:192 stop:773 length:582 start_codon:yes stop_codon:yes gene_type:complete